jgi:hypothetical protein
MSTSPLIEVLSPAGDGLHLELRDPSGTVTRLSAPMVDELMRSLAQHRSRLHPVHPAEPPSGSDQVYSGDNLLWIVRPSPDRPAVDIGIQHPGLGWIILTLSRAQIEDLTASLAFTSSEIRRTQTGSEG